MSLTDDWKAGKLERDRYYYSLQKYLSSKNIVLYRGEYLNCWRFDTIKRDGTLEILDIVPTYEELQQVKSLAENGQSAIDTNQRLSKKIESLKELLKESRDILNVEGYYPTVYKINAALADNKIQESEE